MSVAAVRAVLKYSEARLSARLVMLVLADSAHDDGITWLGQAEIAGKALISRAEVDRSVKELESTGELEKRKAQRGRRRINVYRVTLTGIDEPAYDDLPFTLDQPFTVSHPETPSKNDGVSSGASTVSHLAQVAEADTALRVLNRKGEPSGSNEPDQRVMPTMTLIDDRNLGLDALAEECAIKPTDRPAMKVAGVYLAGRKDRGERSPGIREAFWVEASEWAEENAQLDRLDALPVEEFERALARGIHRKADLYRQRFPGLPVTPKSLLEWWGRLTGPAPANPAAGMTADDIRRRIAEEEAA